MAPVLVALAVGPASARDLETVRPLHRYGVTQPADVLEPGTLLLDRPPVIERFLAALDTQPPDWRGIYGPGDDAHMDRLFDVNRARDRRRAGKPALGQRIAFLWEGVMTGYQPETGGFRLAIGPKVIPTSWGDVRFKPYGLPGGLVAVPPPDLRERLRARKARGETLEVDVLLSGRLLSDESIIYDFSHEVAGQGMVMPVVQVERVAYFLAD